jgi:hypothetical protein
LKSKAIFDRNHGDLLASTIFPASASDPNIRSTMVFRKLMNVASRIYIVCMDFVVTTRMFLNSKQIPRFKDLKWGPKTTKIPPL